jgi:hypothetical protein
MEKARKIHSIYFQGTAFPTWVLDSEKWQAHDFESVKVFYDSNEKEDDVKLLMMEREPCNIGMKRLYNKTTLKNEFGYEEGAYRYSTQEKLMPSLAVYTHAHVKLRNRFDKVHVINLIGVAFDHPYQPDFIFFREKPLTDIIQFYRRMWIFALEAMKQSPCKKLQIYNVGGGAFSGKYMATFTHDIFEPAMKPLLPLFEKEGFSVVGYDWKTHQFTGGFIPDCLESGDVQTTMYVNAWDPWTLIGNGNERDRSLDGYWGRSSNMAVLGWLHTNPWMKFIPVNISV